MKRGTIISILIGDGYSRVVITIWLVSVEANYIVHGSNLPITYFVN